MIMPYAVTLDMETALNNGYIYLVAPMRHPEKGIGWVVAPITRELMTDQCPALLSVVDGVIDYHTGENGVTVTYADPDIQEVSPDEA